MGSSSLILDGPSILSSLLNDGLTGAGTPLGRDIRAASGGARIPLNSYTESADADSLSLEGLRLDPAFTWAGLAPVLAAGSTLAAATFTDSAGSQSRLVSKRRMVLLRSHSQRSSPSDRVGARLPATNTLSVAGSMTILNLRIAPMPKITSHRSMLTTSQ